MKYKQINRKRLSKDEIDECANYDALFRGGAQIRKRIAHLMPRRPAEPEAVYDHRKTSAHYVNYAGPILNYLASWLFTGRLDIRTRESSGTSGTLPEWAGGFKDDVDTHGTDLLHFMRGRLVRALVDRWSWILVDFPFDTKTEPPETLADWQARGLGRGYFVPYDASDVINWSYDDTGELQWAVIYDCSAEMDAPDADPDMIRERWTVWRRDTWERFELKRSRNSTPQEDAEVPKVNGGNVPTGRVPLVKLELPEELWAMNLLYSPQLESFRMRNALSWNMQRTCYAMRKFKRKEPGTELPIHGSGYALDLGIGEEAEWDAPGADSFSPIADYTATLKDEIYRIISQMALGVDNNAAAVGRSGESKQADADAGIVVLSALGLCVSDAVEKGYDLLSAGRGEKERWHAEGLTSFITTDLSSLVVDATGIATINIPSPTFQRIFTKRIALAAVPDASQVERDSISEEIDTAITPESIAAAEGDEALTKPGAAEGYQTPAQEEAASARSKMIVPNETGSPAPSPFGPAGP